MVGIFADDGTHTPVIEELVFAFTQMQGDFSTTIFFSDVGNGVFTFASRFPEDAVFWFSPAARVRTVTLSATINAE